MTSATPSAPPSERSKLEAPGVDRAQASGDECFGLQLADGPAVLHHHDVEGPVREHGVVAHDPHALLVRPRTDENPHLAALDHHIGKREGTATLNPQADPFALLAVHDMGA